VQGLTQSSNQPPARQGTTGWAETQQQEFTVYLQQLIEENRRYPRAARRRNIVGSVEFSVHVSRAGALAELTLNSSSGSRILDEDAEDLLERVFPVDYPLQENVRTTIRIIYKLTEV
jgi:protein TonB